MEYDGKKIFIMGQYPAVYMPEHPRANHDGAVYVHVLVAEEKLGRYLSKEEHVHHVNEDKQDYRKENIWVFKTRADHSRYHKVLSLGLNFALLCTNGVFECIAYSSAKQISFRHKKENSIPKKIRVAFQPNVCQKCKKPITRHAVLCCECRKTYNRRNRPNRDTLKQLLSMCTYREIARQYKVSDTAVRKWVKNYGLYEPKFKTAPPKEQLSSLLASSSRRQVSKMLNVSPDIIKRWEFKLNINPHLTTAVRCIEDGVIYQTKKDAPHTQNMATCKNTLLLTVLQKPARPERLIRVITGKPRENTYKTSTTSSNWQSRRLLIVRFRNRGPGGALMACSSTRNRIAASQVADARSCLAQVSYY